jgi:hypothetical protein
MKDSLTNPANAAQTSAPTLNTDKENKKEIHFHPEYLFLEDWLQMLLDGFNGGRRMTGNSLYLHSHRREDPRDLTFRARRVTYYNYGLMISDIFTGILSETPPNVSGQDGGNVSDDIAEFQKDVDLQKSDMMEFFKEDVVPMALVHGAVCVIVDVPAIPKAGEVEVNEDGTPVGGAQGYEEQEYYKSRQDEIDNNHRPYVRPIFMSDIVNWQMKNKEEFEWVLIRERVRISAGPLEELPGDGEEYVLWDAVGWQRLDADGIELAQGEHPVGECPVVLIQPSKAKVYELIPASWLAEIVELAIKAYNLDSLADEYYYKQCFAQLAVEGKVPKVSGTGNAMSYEKGAHPPSFITPPSDPVEALEAKIKAIIREIYRIACLPYATDSKAPETGVSKQWDWVQLSKRLRGLSKTMGKAETKIYRLVGQWLGEEEAWKATAVWPTEFVIETAEETIDMAERSMLMPIGTTAKTLLHQKATRRLLPDVTPEMQKAIDDEVEEEVGAAGEAFDPAQQGAVGEEPDVIEEEVIVIEDEPEEPEE